MDLFFRILTEITLPIVVIAAVGFVAQKRLNFHVPTLNQLQVYVILPAFLMHYLSSSKVQLSEVTVTVWFTIIQFLFLIIVGWLIAKLLNLPKSVAPVMGLTAAFANSGNYGLPLVQLAFGEAYILHQAVIVSLHSILITSLGVVLISDTKLNARSALTTTFKTPLIPAVCIGLALNASKVQLPNIAAVPLEVLGSAYTPVALFALGAQLAVSHWQSTFSSLGVGLALKLLIAPGLTYGAVILLGIPETLGDFFIVIASAPVGVLLAIICAEYRSNESLASGVVFFSTLLSPIFVTATIFLTRIY